METKNSVMLLILYTNPPFKHKIIDFVTVQDNHGHPVKVLFTYEWNFERDNIGISLNVLRSLL